MFPIVYHVMSHNIGSISGHTLSKCIRCLSLLSCKRLVATKDTTGIVGLLQEKSAEKIIGSDQ
jgi:hypothetical protein